MRSKWKPSINLGLRANVKLGQPKIFDRTSKIMPSFLGKRVLVYNGQKFVSLLIRSWHINRSLGLFVLSKKIGRIHKVVSLKGKKGKK